MRLTALLLVLALPAYGQEELPALAVSKGTQAPAEGVFLTTAKALEVAQRCKEAQLERDALKKQLESSTGGPLVGSGWVFVAGVVLGVVAGALAVGVVRK